MTEDDRDLQTALAALIEPGTAPEIRHLVGGDPDLGAGIADAPKDRSLDDPHGASASDVGKTGGD